MVRTKRNSNFNKRIYSKKSKINNYTAIGGGPGSGSGEGGRGTEGDAVSGGDGGEGEAIFGAAAFNASSTLVISFCSLSTVSSL